MEPRIAVVGAGIIGLSTAVRILQALPRAEVTIFAERTSPHTTSDVAAGFWGPSFLGKTPSELVISWAKETYDFLARLAKQNPDSSSWGIMLSPGYEVYGVDDPPTHYWSHIPIGFRAATPQELAMFPSRVKSGFYYVTTVVEGSKFMPHLINQFKSLGGKLVENRRVESFAELQQLGYDRIVNCTGLGARQLCGDQSVYPIRGQVHRVAAPWLKFWFDSDDGAYCLMNADHAVLGGVVQPNNWDTRVSQADKACILARNYAVWPALRGAPVLADLVGLRPGRDTVRLEREVVSGGPDGAAQCTVYHNYGHGGSGLTLFWGCARDIVQLLLRDIQAGSVVAGRL